MTHILAVYLTTILFQFISISQDQDFEDDLLDPLDIYFSSANKPNNGVCKSDSKYGLEHSLIKILLRSMLRQVHEKSSTKYSFILTFSNETIPIMEQYMQKETCVTALLRIKPVLEDVILVDEVNDTNIIQWVTLYFYSLTASFAYLKKTEAVIHLSYAIIIVFGIFSALNYFQSKNPLTFLIFLMIAQPVLVEWIRLYHKGIAFKMSQYGKGVPRSCKNVEEMSYFDSMMLWASNSFVLKSDECHQYYSRILVDPLTEISILEAISSAVRRFLGNYIVDFAKLVNQSFLTLLSNLPIQWQLIMFIAIISIIILIIVVYSGLQVWTPLLGIKFVKHEKETITTIETEKELRMIQIIKETVKEEISRNLDETREEMQKMLTLSYVQNESEVLNSTKIDQSLQH